VKGRETSTEEQPTQAWGTKEEGLLLPSLRGCGNRASLVPNLQLKGSFKKTSSRSSPCPVPARARLPADHGTVHGGFWCSLATESDSDWSTPGRIFFSSDSRKIPKDIHCDHECSEMPAANPWSSSCETLL